MIGGYECDEVGNFTNSHAEILQINTSSQLDGCICSFGAARVLGPFHLRLQRATHAICVKECIVH